MQQLLRLRVFCLLLIISSYSWSQTIPESRSVQAYATVDEDDPSITLHWSMTNDAINYKVYKREIGSTSWGQPLTTKSASEDTFYVDNAVTIGEAFEYKIAKQTNTADPLIQNRNIIGYSYLQAAIKKEAVHNRGLIYILVESIIYDSLSSEIETLRQDLIHDGWETHISTVDQAKDHLAVKEMIKQKKDESGCDAVFLIGHVAVPYSGTYCTDNTYQYPPDGHTAAAPPSHCGAWPSDFFYGELEGNWTDSKIDSTADYEANRNRINDNKFDNIRLPGDLTIGIGRIDFSDLPKFDKNEIELTRQYLNKTHAFKMGETVLKRSAVIEDNFNSGGAAREGFSSAAIRDFAAELGPDKIVFDDIFQTTRTGDYLLAYGCGAGSFTSCSGVGHSDSFVSHNAAAFNQFFGSYFGDWNYRNNFMRASIASEKLGFSCIWSGRPKWVTHSLAMGETYADVVLSSANNWLDYDAGYYQNATHMALLGDPSLRHIMVEPPSVLVLKANSDSTEVTLNWSKSDEDGISGYHVYRSHKGHGGYVLITTTPLSEVTFTDENPYDGTNHYMVRALKTTSTGSGSYENLSLGTSSEINGIKGVTTQITTLETRSIRVYPTLVRSTINIESNHKGELNYQIMNSLGAELLNGKCLRSIDLASLPSGVYFLNILGENHKFIKQ